MTSLSKEYGSATVAWNGDTLTASTGLVERVWRRTMPGLSTILLRHRENPAEWIDFSPDNGACDWRVFHLMDMAPAGELRGVDIRIVERPSFTSPHIEVRAEFVYAAAEFAAAYTIRVYPNAPGLWTQLALQGLRSFEGDEIPSYIGGSYAEKIGTDIESCIRTAVGYYNDCQHRNRDETAILRETRQSGPATEGRREVYDWANLLCLDRKGSGLALVKESHKCVNQSGVDTGEFVLDADGVRVTGLGLTPHSYEKRMLWLQPDRFRPAWANWCVLYHGGSEQRQLAVKRFDRLRFLPRPEADLRIRANTWGSRPAGAPARAAAVATNVRRELESCADLGIDILAIDDGWQCDPQGLSVTGDHGWRPHPARFPGGWREVAELAARLGIELGLWIPGSASAEDMIRNLDEGGFTMFKIDFTNLPTPDSVEDLMEKARQLAEHDDRQVRLSWDVTENAPRLGYFFGRQYGNLYPANRKAKEPRIFHVAYIPRLVLRDAWHLARYVNLGQIEISIQNVDCVDPLRSNAAEYGHAYCTALALMGLPVFFQETHFYSAGARDRIRPLLALQRTQRDLLGRGFVFPIGDEPCDATWCGFQCHDPERKEGLLTVFRELHAPEDEKELRLHFMGDRTHLEIEEPLTGGIWTERVGNGAMSVRIPDAPGFRILRYRTTSPDSDT
jgi:hypothetical protein